MKKLTTEQSGWHYIRVSIICMGILMFLLSPYFPGKELNFDSLLSVLGLTIAIGFSIVEVGAILGHNLSRREIEIMSDSRIEVIGIILAISGITLLSLGLLGVV